MTARKHLAYCRIARDGRVLFLRRHASAFRGGAWELPGGTVETGEPPERTAVREAAEETGLRVTITAELGRGSWPDITGKPLQIDAVVYAAEETDATANVVLNPDEHDGFAWFSPAETADLGLPPHFRLAVY